MYFLMSTEKVGEVLTNVRRGYLRGVQHSNKSLVGYQSPLTSNLLTPQKSNMEPEKYTLGKGETSTNHQLLASMLLLGGVYLLLYV